MRGKGLFSRITASNLCSLLTSRRGMQAFLWLVPLTLVPDPQSSLSSQKSRPKRRWNDQWGWSIELGCPSWEEASLIFIIATAMCENELHGDASPGPYLIS